jgi:hypothetical protein
MDANYVRGVLYSELGKGDKVRGRGKELWGHEIGHTYPHGLLAHSEYLLYRGSKIQLLLLKIHTRARDQQEHV